MQKHITRRLPLSTLNSAQRLLILIVAKGQYTEPLQLALNSKNKEEYSCKIEFSFCEDIDQILSRSEETEINPDYIVYVIDPTNSSGLYLAEENIRKVDPNFLSAGRFCLVDGQCSCRPPTMKIPLGHINILSQKYSLVLINGDVLIPEKCMYLASRILILATSVSGYHTGLPITLDIPGYEESFI